MTDREHRIDTGSPEELAQILARKTKEVEAVIPATEYQSCRWCSMGYEQIESSVSRYQVHPDSPVGRVLCGIQDNSLPMLPGIAASRLEDKMTALDHLKQATGSLGGDQDDKGNMDGLMMKYFVLKPHGKDQYSRASRAAMRRYAKVIAAENPTLASDLISWADREYADQFKDDGIGEDFAKFPQEKF